MKILKNNRFLLCILVGGLAGLLAGCGGGETLGAYRAQANVSSVEGGGGVAPNSIAVQIPFATGATSSTSILESATLPGSDVTVGLPNSTVAGTVYLLIQGSGVN